MMIAAMGLHVEESMLRAGRVKACRPEALAETVPCGTCRCSVDCRRRRSSFLVAAAAPSLRGSRERNCRRRSSRRECNPSRSAAVLALPATALCAFHTVYFDRFTLIYYCSSVLYYISMPALFCTLVKGQYASSGNRAYCYAEFAVSSQAGTVTTASILIMATHGGMARLS